MHFTTATVLAGFAAFASAMTPPNTSEAPSGNAIIHPGLNEIIPAGTTYDITWTPTTQGNVSLILLRGPSTNVVPLMTITDSTPNTGSFSWAVPSSLQADTTHYGVELVVEGTGQYQYSPQCGVSNSASSASSWASSSYSTTVTIVPATWTGSASSSSSSSSSSSRWSYATGTGNWSSSIISPSSSMTVPSSLMTSTSMVVLTPTLVPSATATFAPAGTSQAVATGAAVANVANNIGAMMFVGLVGAFAL